MSSQYSHHSSTESPLRWNRKGSNDTHHKFTVPWYWRLIALFDSSILLGGFLAIQPLYEKHPNLTVPKTTISILAIASLTLGWALTPLLFFAVHSHSFRAEAVAIPCLSSSLLALLVLGLNFVLTNKYQWAVPGTLGVASSAISAIFYGMLLIWTQFQLRQQRNRLGRETSEMEASLLSSAAPVERSSQSGPSQPAWHSSSAPDTSQGNEEAHKTHTLNNPSGSQTPPRDNSPQPTYQSPLRHPSPQHPFIQLNRPPIASTPPSAIRSDSPHSTFTLPVAPGEAPIETIHVPPPSTEEEMLRQQMLRLLVNQTSAQAKQNPEHDTFQIEVPRQMREALMRVSLEDESIRRAAQDRGLGADRGRTAVRVGSNSFEPGRSGHAVRRGGTVGGRNSSMVGAQSAVVSPISIQPTPQSVYPNGVFKTREERRREIENSVD